MPDTAQRVPEDSATYREFARLYDVARRLRPTGIDRWNRELYATSGVGYFDQRTGSIEMHDGLLRKGLGPQASGGPRWQAAALATVLNRATQAGMVLDAPGEANAVRTNRSLGLNDGVASVRAAADLRIYNRMAGYPRLAYDEGQETGAHAAANGLIAQAAGPRVSRAELIDHLGQGPVALHFDRLAEGVVRNRLEEVAPPEGADRRALRAELIGTMLHPRWDDLAQRSPETGRQVAEEIGRALDAKVDELRHRHQHANTASDGVRQESAERTPTPDTHRPTRDSGRSEVSPARFLSGVAPAAGAAGTKPSLGDGSRGASVDRGAASVRSRGADESLRR
jgi:hypothetical protein